LDLRGNQRGDRVQSPRKIPYVSSGCTGCRCTIF